MRIAFVVGEFPSPSVTFIINQIISLIDRGHEVDIYPSRANSSDKVHSAIERYRLLDRTTYPPAVRRKPLSRIIKVVTFLFGHPLGDRMRRLRVFSLLRHSNPLRWVGLLLRVAAFVPGRRYDIIHCHFAPNALCILLARDIGIIHGRLLTTFHGYDVNTYPRTHGPDCYRDLFRLGDLYTANSDFTTQRAVALGCPSERIVKLPVGVDTTLFEFAERRYEAGGELRVLTVARLMEVKGIEYGIRAVAKLLPACPNLCYRIAGEGPLRNELEQLAVTLGVAECVDFLGAQTQDEVRRLYADAHVFMLPGVVGMDGAEEGQGLVLIEAQATGLPVLATRVGGIPDSILDGESGYLVDERDVGALSAKLRYLLEHPEIWPEMGRAGRAFVERYFDNNRLNDHLEELYRTLVEEKWVPASHASNPGPHYEP